MGDQVPPPSKRQKLIESAPTKAAAANAAREAARTAAAAKAAVASADKLAETSADGADDQAIPESKEDSPVNEASIVPQIPMSPPKYLIKDSSPVENHSDGNDSKSPEVLPESSSDHFTKNNEKNFKSTSALEVMDKFAPDTEEDSQLPVIQNEQVLIFDKDHWIHLFADKDSAVECILTEQRLQIRSSLQDSFEGEIYFYFECEASKF